MIDFHFPDVVLIVGFIRTNNAIYCLKWILEGDVVVDSFYTLILLSNADKEFFE
jgi:hypothetical protein